MYYILLNSLSFLLARLRLFDLLVKITNIVCKILTECNENDWDILEWSLLVPIVGTCI